MVAFFELSWAVLCTIGLANIFFGISLIGAVGLSVALVIPLAVSIATGVANGLCYYVFYTDASRVNRAVGAVFAHICWLVRGLGCSNDQHRLIIAEVQEVGLCSYTYIILRIMLPARQRTIYTFMFMCIAAIASALRLLLSVLHVKVIVRGSLHLEQTMHRLHVGYYLALAALESIGAVLLLRRVVQDTRLMDRLGFSTTTFWHLIHSTEFWLALLAVIGISRAVCHLTQPWFGGAEATSLASQIDVFLYTLECLFPVSIYLDILMSKIISLNRKLDDQSQDCRRDRMRWRTRQVNKRNEEDALELTITSN